jgi:hypothetical protein
LFFINIIAIAFFTIITSDDHHQYTTRC